MADALQARAYTQFGRIHLGRGASPDDFSLLAHEVAHALQQTLAATQLGWIGLSPAPADTVLRAPFDASPFEERARARDALANPFTPLQLLIPPSLHDVLAWSGNEGLAARVTRAVPEALDSTLNSLRRLKGWWAVGQRQVDAFPARKDRWELTRDQASNTDDPSLAAAMRNVASDLAGFVGVRWTHLQQMMLYSIQVAEAGASLWRGGLDIVDAATADRLNTLAADVATIYDEFAPSSWVVRAVRTALGCPDHVRSRMGVLGWIAGLRLQADDMIRSLAGPAGMVTASGILTNSLGAITAQVSVAQALRGDLADVVGILDDPEGFATRRDELRTLLQRVRPQLAATMDAVSQFADVPGVVLGGLCLDMQSWGRAPAFAYFAADFQWMLSIPASVATWASEQEPVAFELVADALRGVDRWSALAIDATVESDELEDAYSPFSKGWRRIFDPILYFGKSKNGLVKRLMKRIPFLRELANQAPALWKKAQSLLETLKDEIIKTRTVVAPLWRFLIGVLSFELPEGFVSDIVNRGATIIGKILRHPLRFLKTLARGFHDGLVNFAANIGDHLLQSLLDWLLGEFDLTPPPTIGKILGALLQRIKLTRSNVCERIAAYLNAHNRSITGGEVETRLDRLVRIGALSIRWLVYLFRGQFAEFWAEVKDHLAQVWEWLVGVAIDYAVNKLKAALPRVIAKLVGGAILAVFEGIKLLYDAIQTAIRYAQHMLAIVRRVFDAVEQIASGHADAAAKAVENAAAKGLSVALGFLARFAGLNGITDYLKSGLAKVGEWVDKALDTLVRLTGRVWIWLFDAEKKAKDWLLHRRTFADAAGDSRTLSYETVQSKAVLHVTVPQAGGFTAQGQKQLTLMAFIKSFTPADDHEEGIKAEILRHAVEIDEIRDAGSIGQERGEEIMVRFNEIVRLLSELGGDRVTPPATVVDWKPVRLLGEVHGSEMLASPLSIDPGGNIGSEPVGTSTRLWREVQGRYSDSHYVKGHLLNHNLHGPGTWNNLMPIARNTNTRMNTVAEQHVKEAVRGQNRVVQYQVKMIFGRHNRKPRTNAEADLPSEVKMSAYEMKYRKGKWTKTNVAIFDGPPLENELRPR